jgi:hypothetical protein
MAASLVP